MSKPQIYNIFIDENDLEFGLSKMSLVEDPAVNVNFLKFSDNKIVKTDTEQRVVTSVAILADTPIKRIDEMGELYYVVFNKETIKQLVKKFFRDDLTKSVNINHSDDTNDAYLIESYIVNEKLGIKPKGIHTTEGSWVCSYHITDDKLWEDIKQGKLNGFSIEVMSYLEKFSKVNNSSFIKSIINGNTKELLNAYNKLNKK